MANTLTSLTPDLYAALDVVSRELVGMVPAVSRDSSIERAAVGQTVRSAVAPEATAADVTAGQLPADNGNNTITNKTISISKSRYVPVRWSGEEQLGMNTGQGYSSILGFQFEQGMRTLVNEMESDLAGLYTKASIAYAPAGTTLFDAANYKDVANVAKGLDLNGAPLSDRHLVLSPNAAGALMGNATYSAANTAGSDSMLRQGILSDHFGMNIHKSQQIASAAIGTNSGGRTNNAGYAIGATVLTLDSNGTGTIIAGDVITIAGDASASAYVVVSGDTDVSDGGTITLAEPGLKGVLSAATHTITTNASAERNMAFSRNAIHLVTRAPARPIEGDLADDVMIIQDPRSGVAFEVSLYKEYRRIKYEISAAWGFEMIKPEHCVLLID